jgi:deazaflavin-dependent oxidoreductase (nitroreductase family)
MARHFRRTLARRLIDAGATAVIKRGIGPRQRYLLTVVGRKTRAAYATPVSLVVDGNDRYLVAAYGEVGWVRNTRAAGAVTLARGDRIERSSIVDFAATTRRRS